MERAHPSFSVKADPVITERGTTCYIGIANRRLSLTGYGNVALRNIYPRGVEMETDVPKEPMTVRGFTELREKLGRCGCTKVWRHVHELGPKDQAYPISNHIHSICPISSKRCALDALLEEP